MTKKDIKGNQIGNIFKKKTTLGQWYTSNAIKKQKSSFLPIILINHTDKIGRFVFLNRIQLCVEIAINAYQTLFVLDME